MKKSFACMTLFLSIVLSGCGESGITVTGDNATITTNAENNNAQVIADTDVTTNVDVESDKSINNTTNNVSESSIKDSNEYKQLQSEFDQLKEQNAELENKVNELESKDDTMPSIEYKDLGLSIDGEEIPINKSDSMVTIDGREYVSKEIADKLISDNQNITITDGTIFIGKVIADKVSLFNITIMDQSNFDIIDTITDSYGNNYANALYCHTGNTGKKYIIYVLNNEYSFIKFKLAIRDDSRLEDTGIISIKADDVVVYTSENLNKTTEPFTEYDIPINNCKLLTITYDCGLDKIDCIIPEAEVYN